MADDKVTPPATASQGCTPTAMGKVVLAGVETAVASARQSHLPVEVWACVLARAVPFDVLAARVCRQWRAAHEMSGVRCRDADYSARRIDIALHALAFDRPNLLGWLARETCWHYDDSLRERAALMASGRCRFARTKLRDRLLPRIAFAHQYAKKPHIHQPGECAIAARLFADLTTHYRNKRSVIDDAQRSFCGDSLPRSDARDPDTTNNDDIGDHTNGDKHGLCNRSCEMVTAYCRALGLLAASPPRQHNTGALTMQGRYVAKAVAEWRHGQALCTVANLARWSNGDYVVDWDWEAVWDIVWYTFPTTELTRLADDGFLQRANTTRLIELARWGRITALEWCAARAARGLLLGFPRTDSLDGSLDWYEMAARALVDGRTSALCWIERTAGVHVGLPVFCPDNVVDCNRYGVVRALARAAVNRHEKALCHALDRVIGHSLPVLCDEVLRACAFGLSWPRLRSLLDIAATRPELRPQRTSMLGDVHYPDIPCAMWNAPARLRSESLWAHVMSTLITRTAPRPTARDEPKEHSSCLSAACGHIDSPSVGEVLDAAHGAVRIIQGNTPIGVHDDLPGLCWAAASCGNVAALAWLDTLARAIDASPWTEEICEAAACASNIAALQWLRERHVPPCPWNPIKVIERACDRARSRRRQEVRLAHYAIVRWVLEHSDLAVSLPWGGQPPTVAGNFASGMTPELWRDLRRGRHCEFERWLAARYGAFTCPVTRPRG